jgi:hypothetical protein
MLKKNSLIMAFVFLIAALALLPSIKNMLVSGFEDKAADDKKEMPCAGPFCGSK